MCHCIIKILAKRLGNKMLRINTWRESYLGAKKTNKALKNYKI